MPKHPVTYALYSSTVTYIPTKLRSHHSHAPLAIGYVWLVKTSREPKADLEIVVTPNEESPLSRGLIPMLVIDMWERAYYEQFSWNREIYIKVSGCNGGVPR